jgi:protocatechuate 3,4-dioxygenase beta subunit
MRAHRIVLVVVAVACAPALAQQQAPLTIRGRVFAAENREALPRARITIAVDRDTTAPVYTDDHGEFSIALPSAASFTLSVVKAKFAVMQMPLKRAALAATKSDIAIALTRSAAVNGRIVDRTGETVVGLRVYADRLDKDADTPSGLLKFATTTDDRGEYRLGGLPPGRYAVTATNALDPGSVATLVLRPGDSLSSIDFTAQPPPESALTPSPQLPETRQRGTIRGRVISTGGRPLAQAVVSINGPMPPRYFLTDAQGRFTFAGLIAGEYEVGASRGDFLPGTLGQQTAFESTSRVAVASGARVNDITLVLTRGFAVSGTIVDRSGEPMQGVSMVALQLSANGNQRVAMLAGAMRGGTHQTDDRGQYRVFGLERGTYIVAALADTASLGGAANVSQPVPFYFPGSASISYAVPVTVAKTDVAGIDFTLGEMPSARVTGVALDSSGAALKGTVTLAVSQRSGSVVPEPRTTQTEADGAFTFVNVAPGDYVVQAVQFTISAARFERGSSPIEAMEFAAQYVSVGAEDADPVRLRTARGAIVEGQVLVLPTLPRDSPDRMQIEAHPVDVDLAPTRTNEIGNARVDRGRFRIPAVFGARRFVLSGMPEGYYLKSMTVNGVDVTDRALDFGVGAASTASAEVVVSSRGGAIVGRTIGSADAVAGSTIVVFPHDREKWFARSRFVKVARPSREGVFRAASLPPGEYYVVATSAFDPATSREALERLVTRAATVSLSEAEERSVDLAVP